MHTIRGKVAEQQDKNIMQKRMACVLGESHLNRGTADSADDWSVRTTQGIFIWRACFCPVRRRACVVHRLFVSKTL
jgi:hypothetical protein